MKNNFTDFSVLSSRGMFNWGEWKPNTVDNTCVLIGKFGTFCYNSTNLPVRDLERVMLHKLLIKNPNPHHIMIVFLSTASQC